MGEARQRVAQLSARLAALDAEIATLRTTLVQVEHGQRDAELPALYAALLDRATLDAVAAGTADTDADAAAAMSDTAAAEMSDADGDDAHTAEASNATEMTAEKTTTTATEAETKEQQKQQQGEIRETTVKTEPSETTGMEEDGEGQKEVTATESKETVEKEEEGAAEEEAETEASTETNNNDAEGGGATEATETTAAELHALQGRLDAVLGAAMRRDRETRFFDHAVTADEAPMYAQEVLCACDFGLLRRRLRRGRYGWPACASVRDACALFARDLALVFANAAVFNPPGSASGVLELSRKILQSARRHLAEHHIWPLPTPADCAALLPRRRVSRVATTVAGGGGAVATSTDAGSAPGDTEDADPAAVHTDEPVDADSAAATHPPNKRRRRSSLAAS